MIRALRFRPSSVRAGFLSPSCGGLRWLGNGFHGLTPRGESLPPFGLVLNLMLNDAGETPAIPAGQGKPSPYLRPSGYKEWNIG